MRASGVGEKGRTAHCVTEEDGLGHDMVKLRARGFSLHRSEEGTGGTRSPQEFQFEERMRWQMPRKNERKIVTNERVDL